MYTLNPHSKVPLYLQLYNEMKYEVINHLHVGDKLPSIRKISQEYQISKNTVESAFSQLYAEGYIESKNKSGYFVSDINTLDLHAKGTLTQIEASVQIDYIYDFYPARLSQDTFPIKLWKRLFNKVMDESLDFGAYPNGQGEIGLRKEIAKYLIDSRGVKCSAEQVILFGSFMDSVGLVARLFNRKSTGFAIEHPGYHVARRVFESYDYEISKIGVDENGILLQELENSQAKLVYITPSHQYPTGVAMPIANRLRLLQWANKNNAFIIEDDYDSEMSYKNRPIPCLQGLYNDDRVIYIGTFSKSLSPALRVSYMVLPFRFTDAYKGMVDYNFPRVSLSTQKTLELFMREGHWERHLRKVRNSNRKKHDIMKECLQSILGNSMKIVSEGGGLAILIQPACEFDLTKLKVRAEEEKLKIYFAKERSGGEFEALRMGFGGFKESEIPKAVQAFARVWFECTY